MVAGALALVPVRAVADRNGRGAPHPRDDPRNVEFRQRITDSAVHELARQREEMLRKVRAYGAPDPRTGLERAAAANGHTGKIRTLAAIANQSTTWGIDGGERIGRETVMFRLRAEHIPPDQELVVVVQGDAIYAGRLADAPRVGAWGRKIDTRALLKITPQQSPPAVRIAPGQAESVFRGLVQRRAARQVAAMGYGSDVATALRRAARAGGGLRGKVDALRVFASQSTGWQIGEPRRIGRRSIVCDLRGEEIPPGWVVVFQKDAIYVGPRADALPAGSRKVDTRRLEEVPSW